MTTARRILPQAIRDALKCAPEVILRPWRSMPLEELTRAERNMLFIESFLLVPEGKLVGQPLVLEPFQEAFIYAIYDNPAITTDAYLSIARKNGKTGLIAALLIVHLDGPEAMRNSQIVSGAMSRDQAALVYNLASKMITMSPQLSSRIKPTPSGKKLHGLAFNVEYKALSADASTAHGLSPVLAILDEIGQVVGPRSDFIDAITTAQGAYDNPLLIAISTSAPSDSDLFSIWCDDAVESKDEHIVLMECAAEEGCGLLDETQWRAANPALGKFRSEADLRKILEKADRLPTQEATARNLYLNQRVAMEGVWLAPSVWKENNAKIDMQVFQHGDLRIGKTALGLDLSQRNDITAAVLAAMDSNKEVHLLPYCFTPREGLKDRATADRAPYDVWVDQGFLIALPGRTLNYDLICEWLRDEFDDKNIDLGTVEFDRWHIEDFRQAAQRVGFGPRRDRYWQPVGQGYKDFSPRCTAFEGLILERRVRHGGHPLLNMGAWNAIAVQNEPGSIKLDKAKSSQRIDPLVAAVMAAYAVTEGARERGSVFSDETREVFM